MRVIEKKNLLMLISTAMLLAEKSNGIQWLSDLKEDVQAGEVEYAYGVGLLKGFVTGLYATGFIEQVDEIEFSELVLSLEGALFTPGASTRHRMISDDAELEIRGYALYVDGKHFVVDMPDGYDVWKLDENNNLVLSIVPHKDSVTLTRSKIKGRFVEEKVQG